MSLFLAPSTVHNQQELTKQFKAVIALGLMRRVAIVIALTGLFGTLVQSFMLGFLHQTAFSIQIIKATRGLLDKAVLPVWLGLCLGGLTAAIVLSVSAGKMTACGGKALLASMRDDFSERLLIPLLQQMNDACVLFHPSFQLGVEPQTFDLMAVSPHGVTFINASPLAKGTADLDSIKAACKRLSEQHSLPLLSRARFIQLWEPKISAEWQSCLPRDLSRFFQRNELGAGRNEIAKSLRAMFNLVLPPNLPAIPVEGSLPVPSDLPTGKTGKAVHHHRGIAGSLIKVIIIIFAAISLAGAGLWFLQYIDYETAEKVSAPTRAFFRNTLPVEWQQRLVLGKEIHVNEDHIAALVAPGNPVRLAKVLGQEWEGDKLDPGIRLRLVQAGSHGGKNWYMVRVHQTDGAVGWLPEENLSLLHVVKKGTPLYSRGPLFARSEADISPNRHAEQDYPVALLLIRRIPTSNGEITWSKVSFLDRTIAYVRSEL